MEKQTINWDPSSTPGYLINRIARLLNRLNDQRLTKLSISMAYMPVLGALSENEALSQKELVRIGMIGQPAMAQMLARMEKDGLLQWTADPNDGRSRLYSLTPTAIERLPLALSILVDSNDEIMRGFSPKQKAEFIASLRQLSETLSNAAAYEADK